jgi:hypothetical protein
MVRLVSIFSLVAAAAAQSCTSLSSVVQGNTNSPPAGLGIPGCAYVTANSAAICNTMAAWDIANSDTCYLKGPGYGCTINPGQFSTTVAVYCQLGPAAPVATATASASATSSAKATPTVTPSASGSASVTMTPSASGSTSPSTTETSTLTATPTPSQTPTVSLTSSITPTPTPSQTPSNSPTSSITTSRSITPTGSPSMNIVIIYENAPLSKGVIAAIAFSSIFGILVVIVCCGAVGIFLRRSPPAAHALTERRASAVAERRPSVAAVAERNASVVAVAERRPSKAAEPRRNSIVEPTQRRKSTLELRRVDVQIEKKDLT